MFKVIQNKSSLDGAKYVQFDHDLRKIQVGDTVAWDLFPYKMKNKDNFLFRDHPKGLNPKSLSFINYWEDFGKKCVEGLWIKDGETWVCMIPKLLYYINYVKILGSEDGDEENRREISPDLSSVEWIGGSYFMLVDGFSGFEDDENYTCNLLVKRLAEGLQLNKFERKKLEKSCYKPNGELKVYVHPWEYLTRFYLLDNPQDKPLGKCLYENKRENGIILGARGTNKSYFSFGMDFNHEWTFGGVRNWDNIADANTRLLYAMGSAAKDPLTRSVQIVTGFYDKQPGQFKYSDPKRPKYMGPLYKRVQGSWNDEIQHRVKTKQNKDAIMGSSLQVSILTPDRKRVGAGDRFRRIYIEEAGFMSYITEVHSANKDSMEVGSNKIGSAIYTGTSGDIKAVAGVKKLFEGTKAYSVAGIPNYWKNPENEIGLFLPAYYKYRGLKDEQGNNDIHTALQVLIKERSDNAEQMDSSSFDDYIMYTPITPDEMLRPNRRAFLPVGEAQARLSDLDEYGYWDMHANIGDLEFNASEPYGVRFNKDLSNRRHPIVEYNIDRSKIDLRGAYVLFEPPPERIPENLYWIVYDPVGKPKGGETLDSSLNVAIAYKGFYKGDERTLEDNIVAEWVGREDDLYDNYERVIKLAKYYNAKIFPETNTAGFVSWCYENNYGHMLQEEAYLAEREINPNYRKRGAVGFSIYGDRKKPWLMQKYKSWLLNKRGVDSEGNFKSRTIEHVMSKRMLDEIVNFNETGNFDYTSVMLGLMLLISQIDQEGIQLIDPEEKEEEIRFVPQTRYVRRRSSFEESMY